MYDLIIQNGNIIDGTGKVAFISDVAIKDGKIARIAPNLTGGKENIDATGLTITPGFIDSHSHSDSALKDYPDVIEKIEQGITTSIAGQCGSSVAPTKEEGMDEFLDVYKDNKGNTYYQLFEYIPYKYEPCSEWFKTENNG